MHRLFVSMSAALAAAVLLVVAVSGRAPAGSRAATPEPRIDPYVPTATPCAGGERMGCIPVPAVIVTPEPRPDAYVPTATPCAGGERMGCLPVVTVVPTVPPR